MRNKYYTQNLNEFGVRYEKEGYWYIIGFVLYYYTAIMQSLYGHNCSLGLFVDHGIGHYQLRHKNRYLRLNPDKHTESLANHHSAAHFTNFFEAFGPKNSIV